MHVKTKQVALAGLLAAFAVVLVVLSSVIESSSLFFIAAASFCVGIAVREWGMKIGAAFWGASTFVNFIVSPNKMYCLTFAAMGLYLLGREWIWEKLAEKESLKNRKRYLLVGKIALFNMIFLPVLILFQKLIFIKEVTSGIIFLTALAGQVVFLIYDKAYDYFQINIWGKLRGKLL